WAQRLVSAQKQK
ncbi:NMT1-like family protein, partial [Vibrio parahaemolyticus V-223/04]